jgi:hypothetical protein
MTSLRKIRIELEEAQEWLTSLRFTLASALFVGKPPGAREVKNPRDM